MSRRRNREQHGGLFAGSTGAALALLLLVNTDVSTNVAVTGISAAGIAIPYVNPPPKNNGEKRLAVTPVALFERLTWGSRLPHDLDIWTQCYNLVNGEKSNEITIGYNRKSQLWIDLSRDIQGGLVINEENLQSNAHAPTVPPNTFCRFNVHLWHSHGGPLPVVGHMIVIQNKDSDNEKQLGDVTFSIVVPGQEVTVLTAVWDERGNPIMDAIESYPNVGTVPIATLKSPE